MKNLIILVVVISVIGCKKSDKDSNKKSTKDQIENTKGKLPAKKEVKPKSLCEKAYLTFNKCIIKKALPKSQEPSRIKECNELLKSKNTLYIQDINCWAKVEGDCKKASLCLPKKDKNICESFADTRVKCRKVKLDGKLLKNFRGGLITTCEKEMKGKDEKIKAIYKCFKDSKEVCLDSKKCFKKLVDYQLAKDELIRKNMENKFKKMNKKEKKLFKKCENFQVKCNKTLKEVSKKEKKALAKEECKQIMFSPVKKEAEKMKCFKKFKKKCAKTEKCLNSKK